MSTVVQRKACSSKVRFGNQGPTTRLDSDGSETIVFDLWTTGDNRCRCKCGKTASCKIGSIKKEQTWKMLLKKID
jgi:hypothetical protein